MAQGKDKSKLIAKKDKKLSLSESKVHKKKAVLGDLEEHPGKKRSKDDSHVKKLDLDVGDGREYVDKDLEVTPIKVKSKSNKKELAEATLNVPTSQMKTAEKKKRSDNVDNVDDVDDPKKVKKHPAKEQEKEQSKEVSEKKSDQEKAKKKRKLDKTEKPNQDKQKTKKRKSEKHAHAKIGSGADNEDDNDDDEVVDFDPITLEPLPSKIKKKRSDSKDADEVLDSLPALSSEEATRGVIYLGHIPSGFEELQMKEFFTQFGTVTRLRLARSKKTGGPRGFAFIEFEDAQVASIVAGCMNNYLMFGRLLKCEVVPNEKKHANMFPPKTSLIGDSKTMKRPNRTLAKTNMERQRLERPTSGKALLARQKNRLKRLGIKETRLKSFGIDYSIDFLKEKNMVENGDE